MVVSRKAVGGRGINKSGGIPSFLLCFQFLEQGQDLACSILGEGTPRYLWQSWELCCQ